MRQLPHGEAVLPFLALALFVLLFIAGPLADVGVLGRPFLGMVMLIVTLAGLFAVGTVTRFAVPVITLGGTVFAIQVGRVLYPSATVTLANDIAAGALVLLLCGLLLYVVMRPGPVTVNRISGAITVYLFAALFFALLFDLLEQFAPGAFIMGQQPPPPSATGSGFFYLSVITLTSVGFGDMSPAHPLARSIVMV